MNLKSKLLNKIIDEDKKYLFQNYGDRVKLWLTINEPAAYCGRAFGPVSDRWVWPPGKNGPITANRDPVLATLVLG